MKKQGGLFVALSALFLAAACSDQATAPEEPIEELSTSEQMTIVATELASANGGVMADLQMLAEAGGNGSATLAKSTGLDTTVTRGWITYEMSLAFYTENGVEQRDFVPGVTDSVAYQSTLSGQYSDPVLDINLDTGSSLGAAGLKSLVLRVNGTGYNRSDYMITGKQRKLAIAAASSYEVQNVVVDLNAQDPFPSSGLLVGTLKGTYTVEGLRGSGSKDYEFTVTLEFTGSKEVTVTLPNGTQFTLNLETGQIS